jgi:23S rRNA (uracil1939-C5)-methyltransferase
MNNPLESFTTIAQEAPCQYFGRCGGCRLQNISNHAEYKFSLLQQALKSIEFNGKLHKLEQIHTHSRRRVTFKVNNKKLSFNQFHSKNMIAIGECLLLEDSINSLIHPLNKLLKTIHISIDMISITNSDTGLEILFYAQEKTQLETDLLLTEFARANNIARIAWQTKKQLPSVIIQLKRIALKFNDVYVDLPINSFLQVSKESSDLMTQIILKHLDKAKNILELYSGCGSFTIPISEKGNITAIEGSSSALEVLDNAAKEYKLSISTIKQDLYQNPYSSNYIDSYSQVVINPPRNGATPQIKQIAATNLVKKVILVSCSLENFIRDAKILFNRKFNLKDVYPIDQFLYSNHLEIIGIFER